MITSTGHVNLIDFGFAKRIVGRFMHQVFSLDVFSRCYRTHTLCGTPEYVAPEVIQVRYQCRYCEHLTPLSRMLAMGELWIGGASELSCMKWLQGKDFLVMQLVCAFDDY